jgi:hypothetical protein
MVMQSTKEFIQINNLSRLHDDKEIIFCKTDFILEEFNRIKDLKNEVILITGNSDYSVTDELVELAPKNITRWYAQNALSNSNILNPMPIGIENRVESFRLGHGVGWGNRVAEKEQLLSRKNNIIPDKLIYANFQINTNHKHRSVASSYCNQSKWIDFELPNLSIQDFFNKILEYKMVVCPIGNGIDTHRLWEVLYSDRIPITIKVGNYKIYNLYEKLPIIMLDRYEDLLNIDLIQSEYSKVISKCFNYSLLKQSYWKDKIIYESIY